MPYTSSRGDAGVRGGVAGGLGSPGARKPLVVDTAPTAQAETAKPPTKEVKWAPAVKPKPLSEHVTRGLKWLVEHQLKNGSWGQGEESATMGGGAAMKDIPSVADTCDGRPGPDPGRQYARQGRLCQERARRGQLRLRQVEESDKDTLEVTTTRGTRIQIKLGPYIDTFAASLLLAEVNNQMPDAAGQQRVAAAMNKLLVKIQKNQRPDGTWGGQGWATTLQQNMAVKGLNRLPGTAGRSTKRSGKRRKRRPAKASTSLPASSPRAARPASQLYAAGANLSSCPNRCNTNKQQHARSSEKKATRCLPARRRRKQRPTRN